MKCLFVDVEYMLIKYNVLLFKIYESVWERNCLIVTSAGWAGNERPPVSSDTSVAH